MIPFDNLSAACGPVTFSSALCSASRFRRIITRALDLKVKLAVFSFAFCSWANAQTGEPTDIFFTDCGFILAAELTPPSCAGAADGSALVYPFIGEGLTYEWIGLDNFTNSIANLAAGNYSLAVSDGICTDTLLIPIQDPPAITAPLLDTAICAFNAPINLLDGLDAGYTVTAVVSLLGADVDCAPCASSIVEIDQTSLLEVFLEPTEGCPTSRLVFVSLLDLLTATTSTTPETCNNNGRVEISATGGSGNYLYGLNSTLDFQQSNIFEGLAGGELYTAVVLDLAGCSTSADAVVGLMPTFSPAIVSGANASCFGANNGEIVITGVNANVIGYGLNSSNLTSTQPFFGNLAPGNYTVFVIEPNNCFNGYPVSIEQPQPLLVNTEVANVSCGGGADGLVEINAAGGNGGYRYALNNGVFNPENIFDNLQAGTYLARVQDVRFCENTRVFSISAPDLPDLGSMADPSCANAPTGSIVIVEAGKLLVGDFQFSLDSLIWQSENLFSGLAPGVYTVYIRYPDGCVYSVEATVSESPVLEATYESAPMANGLWYIDLMVVGGVTPYAYAWSNGSTTEDQFNLAQGNYEVSVTDIQGCQSILMVMAGTTASENVAFASGIRVFPVPAQGDVQVRFEMPLAGEVQLQLSDARGTALWQAAFSASDHMDVPLGDFPSGMYWLVVRGGKQRGVYRLVKI